MPPNLLFLLVDCLRADRAAPGQTFARTPTVEHLRTTGTSFTQAIAAAATTTPCVATILTGCYPARHGVRSHSGYKLDPGVPTLPVVLARAGYHTWAEPTGPLAPVSGLDRGYAQYNFRRRLQYLDGQWGEGLRQKLAAMPRPWFGFVHLWELHLPRHVPLAFDRGRFGGTLYDRALSALDEQLARLLAALPGETLVVVHGDHGENIPKTILAERFYNARQRAISALPPQARKGGKAALNRLRPRGGGQSALERVGHGYHLYEFLVRVPLVVSGPGIPAGVTVLDQVRQVDIAPTLVDALGVAWPATVDGRSLLPLARGGALPALPAFSEACGTVLIDPKMWRASIRTGTHKFIYGPNNPDLPEELYDLQADPEERHSLAQARPELAARLKAQLRRAGEAGLEAAPEQTMSDEEMAVLAKRLQDLGYIE